jgi:hypothetical protein
MTDQPGIVILLEETAKGLVYNSESYEVSDFAGGIPAPGDLIAYPGIAMGADKEDPASYTMQEVVRRYFEPKDERNSPPRTFLVIQARQATEEEMEIIAHR